MEYLRKFPAPKENFRTGRGSHITHNLVCSHASIVSFIWFILSDTLNFASLILGNSNDANQFPLFHTHPSKQYLSVSIQNPEISATRILHTHNSPHPFQLKTISKNTSEINSSWQPHTQTPTAARSLPRNWLYPGKKKKQNPKLHFRLFIHPFRRPISASQAASQRDYSSRPNNHQEPITLAHDWSSSWLSIVTELLVVLVTCVPLR